MKKGISLMVMVIIIVILSIITGITIYSAKDSVNMSKLSNFSTNMSKIQDAATAYYTTRGVLPIKSGATALTKEELLQKTSDAVRDELSEKIALNGDDEGTFYVLDIEKINVQETVYNITRENNVLYINDMGTCVYYITGFKVDGTTYFALDVYTRRPKHIICGDVNSDGKVDVTDGIALSQYLSDPEKYEIEQQAADVNTDGKVDSSDATILSKYLADWSGVELNCPDIARDIYDRRPKHIICGDVNSDGKVDATDGIALSQYLSDPEKYEIEQQAADVNADGKVDSSDATILSRYLAGWSGFELNCLDI